MLLNSSSKRHSTYFQIITLKHTHKHITTQRIASSDLIKDALIKTKTKIIKSSMRLLL